MMLMRDMLPAPSQCCIVATSYTVSAFIQLTHYTFICAALIEVRLVT